MKLLTPRWIALATITAITLYVTWLIFEPFINVVLWAIVLTVIATPIYNVILRYSRSANVCAALTLLTVIIAVVIPILFIGQAVVSRADEAAITVQNAAAWMLDANSAHAIWLGQYFDVKNIFRPENVQGQAQRIGAYLASSSADLVGYTVLAVIQLLLILFTTYYLLRDGRKLLLSARDLLPLKQEQSDAMFHNILTIISASLRGTVLIAAIQGILGGVAFWALGVPAPALWGVVMFFTAMIPVVGSSIIWLPAAIYLVSDSWVKAVILLAWGAGVIAMIDNILRPVLVGSKTRMHELTVFFSVLGGLKLFGPVGIVMGPIVVAVAMGLMRIFEESANEIDAAAAQAEAPAACAPANPPTPVARNDLAV